MARCAGASGAVRAGAQRGLDSLAVMPWRGQIGDYAEERTGVWMPPSARLARLCWDAPGSRPRAPLCLWPCDSYISCPAIHLISSTANPNLCWRPILAESRVAQLGWWRVCTAMWFTWTKVAWQCKGGQGRRSAAWQGTHPVTACAACASASGAACAFCCGASCRAPCPACCACSSRASGSAGGAGGC